jgi:phytoene dehydrogenase-like protein
MDWALAGPVPWKSEAARRAGTVHVAASVDEIVRSERAAERGAEPDHPLVILAQPTLFDPTRAPPGRHVLWGYCHVPYGSAVDVSDRIEAQIERCAPGFHDLVLARSAMGPAELELHDANFVGGDIGGGANDALQLLARPVLRTVPYATPHPRLWLCSSSTPPGGGVHGMCGWNAAHAVLAAHAAAERKHSAAEPLPTA